MCRAALLLIALSAPLARSDDPPPRSDTPSAAPTPPGPLLLSPEPNVAGAPKELEIPTNPPPSLSAELEQLKQDQARLRSILHAPDSDNASGDSLTTELTRHLRSQLDNLASELAKKGKPNRSATTRPVGAARTPAPPANGSNPQDGIVTKVIKDLSPDSDGSRRPIPTTTKPVDPIALGQISLRMGDNEAAIRAFRAVELSKLRPDDRAYVQYLLATALRASGRPSEALPLYREVANSRADEVVADCARWQLSLMQWRRDLEEQLEGLRTRRKSLSIEATTTPNSEPPDHAVTMPVEEKP